MGDQAERIHAALLRFKGERPEANSQVQHFVPYSMDCPRVVVVVEEKNLAALASPIVDLPGPKLPGPGNAPGKL
jgi:hypothetical protein